MIAVPIIGNGVVTLKSTFRLDFVGNGGWVVGRVWSRLLANERQV